MTYIYMHKDEAGTSSGRRPKDYVAGRDTRNIFRKKTKDYVAGRDTGQLQEEDQRITLQDVTQK